MSVKLHTNPVTEVEIWDRGNYICKKYPREYEEIYNREVKMLRSLTQPHIIGILDNYFDGKFYCIDLEKMPRTLDECHGLNWGQRRRIMRGILNGLCVCHNNRIIHHDIKPENIAIDDKFNVKLLDFGYSITFGGEWCLPSSLWYRAPEAIYGGHYTAAVDIWAAGCVFYEVMTDKVLFNVEDERELEFKIGKFTPLDFNWAKMLAKDPERRLTAYEALAAI